MALTIIKFNLDINPGLAPQIINVSEYDINRQFIISITENGKPFEIPSNVNATIEGTLNQRGFQTVGNISNNIVSFTLTEAMTASKGRAWVKIKLVQDNSPISTCGFWLNVDRAGVEAGTVIGADGFEEQITKAVDDWLEENGLLVATIIDGDTLYVDNMEVIANYDEEEF